MCVCVSLESQYFLFIFFFQPTTTSSTTTTTTTTNIEDQNWNKMQPQHLFRWSAVESLWSRSDLSRSKFCSSYPIYTSPISLKSPVMNKITTKYQHWVDSNISDKYDYNKISTLSCFKSDEYNYNKISTLSCFKYIWWI